MIRARCRFGDVDMGMCHSIEKKKENESRFSSIFSALFNMSLLQESDLHRCIIMTRYVRHAVVTRWLTIEALQVELEGSVFSLRPLLAIQCLLASLWEGSVCHQDMHFGNAKLISVSAKPKSPEIPFFHSGDFESVKKKTTKVWYTALR